jgi:phage tail sheath protein FI
MSVNVGINVIETEGSAAPAIAGAPRSVTGLVLRSRRGVTDRAVRVSSFRQFTDRFGAHAAGYLGAYAVEGFFQNGGREAWVARVVGTGAAAAQVTLKDRGGSNTIRMGAGSLGSTEAGSWGNDLYVGVRDNPEFSTRLTATLAGNTPARLQGAALTPPIDLSRGSGATADRQLVLDIDTPAQRFTVNFNQASLPVPAQASVEDAADAVNAVAGNRVVASPSAGGLLIVSRSKGANSKVVAVGGVDDATRSRLGFGSTNEASGADGAGTYTEARVESLSGFAAGQWVRLDDSITQDWVQVSALESRDVGGTIESWVQFTAPSAAQRNEYRREEGATLSTTEFDLTISRQGMESEPQPVETWEKLSLDANHRGYAPNRINDQFSGSNYIVVTDLNAATFTGRDVPVAGDSIRIGVATSTTTSLTRVQGTDGAEPTTSEYRAALARFDTVAIQILAAPENMPAGMLTAVTQAAIDYCAGPGKGDCMFVGHTPYGRDVVGAKSFGQGFRAAKVYGALYWPWITVIDPVGVGPNPTRAVPPTGHVVGVYARIDQSRGIWKAPAGQEAVLRGVLDVERDVTDIDHTDLVKNGSINGIRKIPGAGISVDASRTLSTDTRWLYVNVRLLFNFVKASLRDGLRWVKQEPNRQDLWNMVKYGSVTPFLLRLHQQGAFGTGAPAEVFTVICGPENNPPAEVVLGNLQVEVYFFPSRPAETIVIMIGQQESKATAAER